MIDCKLKVIENKIIAKNIFSLTLEVPEMPEIKAGQFIMLETPAAARLLRRPLGICAYDRTSITVCYQVAGKGTNALSEVKSGAFLNMLLPLGNGFPKVGNNIALVGGGVGVFPLLCYAQENPEKNITSCLGFRNAECVCLIDEFNKFGKVNIMTDDGSIGEKGNAVDALFSEMKKQAFDAIFACGSTPMLRALKARLIQEKVNTKCYVSLEERMGCGMGACLVCTCKKSGGGRASVCKEGPVFDIMEVEL